ncbi:MAG: hypothetical protein FWD06_06710 [Oscillospiraceae bacterium]|nr:hypothetical protein [Oscillospiraceae bacterium]
MSDVLQYFVGKHCILTLGNGLNSNQIVGVIKAVDDHYISLGEPGNFSVVQLNAVVQIREHPTNKNGKKKLVV